MIQVLEYINPEGKSPFAEWFTSLDARAAAKVATRLERIAAGNLSNVEGVGKGVFEDKIDFGPGYRLYFGKDGQAIVILLIGGTKKEQPSDIKEAHKLWAEYKSRKRKGAK